MSATTQIDIPESLWNALEPFYEDSRFEVCLYTSKRIVIACAARIAAQEGLFNLVKAGFLCELKLGLNNRTWYIHVLLGDNNG